MHIFARLSKVNVAERTVEGIIASEAVDLSGEIFDYEKSKPNFVRWSEGIAKATEGKSLGNVRVMHGKSVAGITKSLNFDDAAKQITVKAEIVDDNEWNKVQKGCYTGFSIGGRYASKWDDAALGKTRYEADPSEYSLVDLPCNPEAQFTVIKVDGSQELRKFETNTGDNELLAKWVDGLTDEARAALLAKIAPPPADDGVAAEPPVGDPQTDPAATDPEEALKAYLPIAGRLLKVDGAAEHGIALQAMLGLPIIEKSLWQVGDFANLLQRLVYVADDAEWEASYEADNSPVPAQLRAAIKPVAQAFLAMAKEEVEEAIKESIDDTVVVLELGAGDQLGKGGKRHSTKDQAAIDAAAKHHKQAQKHLDAMKGHLDTLQSGTAAPAGETAEKLAKSADDLTKVTVERDGLQKRFDTLSTQYAELLTKAAAPKGVARVLAKDHDGGDLGASGPTEAEAVMKSDGSVDHAATAHNLMKAAHARPMLAR